MTASRRLIDIKELGRMTSLSRTSIYRRIADGSDFPKPIALPGTRRIVWVESEVSCWIDSQIMIARAS